MGNALVTVREAATEFGVSEAAVRRWVSRGRLRGVRVGRALRIDRRALDAVVARGSLDPVPRAGASAAPEDRAPLPWVVRRAAQYVTDIGGDLEMARAALDLVEGRP